MTFSTGQTFKVSFVVVSSFVVVLFVVSFVVSFVTITALLREFVRETTLCFDKEEVAALFVEVAALFVFFLLEVAARFVLVVFFFAALTVSDRIVDIVKIENKIVA